MGLCPLGKIFILTPRRPRYLLWELFHWQHLRNYRTETTNVALAPPFTPAPSFDSHRRVLTPRPLNIWERFLLPIKTTQLPCAPRLPKATCVHVSQTGSLTLCEASPLRMLLIQKDALPPCLKPHLTPPLLSPIPPPRGLHGSNLRDTSQPHYSSRVPNARVNSSSTSSVMEGHGLSTTEQRWHDVWMCYPTLT